MFRYHYHWYSRRLLAFTILGVRYFEAWADQSNSFADSPVHPQACISVKIDHLVGLNFGVKQLHRLLWHFAGQHVISLRTSLGQTEAVSKTLSRARSISFRAATTTTCVVCRCLSLKTANYITGLVEAFGSFFPSSLCYPLTTWRSWDVRTKPKGPDQARLKIWPFDPAPKIE